jgi:heptosyltransferase-1
MSTPPDQARPRILFIRLSALGDVVNTLPALEALRRGFPHAHIGFAVEDRAKDLIVGHPSVDRVHVLERKRWRAMLRAPTQWLAARRELAGFVRELRAERYGIALDFQGNFKGALHSLFSSAPRRIGFARGFDREWSHLVSTEHVTPTAAGQTQHRVHKFLALAAHLGAPVDRPSYRLPDLGASKARVADFRRAAQVGEYVALHPGASGRGALKMWPAPRFGELAARIAHETGLRPVVTWGPGERPLAESVVAASGGAAVLALATTSVLDLAALVAGARLFVGCDSGPLHLASAVSTPSVALFGPKDPRTYGPFHPRNRVVAHGEPGRGSMDAISVEDAFSAVSSLLAELVAGEVAAPGGCSASGAALQ